MTRQLLQGDCRGTIIRDATNIAQIESHPTLPVADLPTDVCWNLRYDAADGEYEITLIHPETDTRIEMWAALIRRHHNQSGVGPTIAEAIAAAGRVIGTEEEQPFGAELAVERMIRVLPENVGRDFRLDPIQEAEREWMRPLTNAAWPASASPAATMGFEGPAE